MKNQAVLEIERTLSCASKRASAIRDLLIISLQQIDLRFGVFLISRWLPRRWSFWATQGIAPQNTHLGQAFVDSCICLKKQWIGDRNL